MALHDLLSDGLAAAAGLGAASLVAKRLPVWATLVNINVTIRKAFNVIGATGISDHWKEFVFPRYAITLLIGSWCLAFYLLAILGVFVSGFVAAELLFMDTLQDALARLWKWEPQLIATVMGILLFLVLQRRRR